MEGLVAVAILVFGGGAVAFAIVVGLFYKFVDGALAAQNALVRDTLDKLLLYTKADSAEQAVALDVQKEALEDAYAQAAADKDTVEEELAPRMVQLEGGREVNLNDGWEPL